MTALASFRAQKDAFMRGKNSPLEPGELPSFAGLRYFPGSERYRVTAALEPFETVERVELTTSAGDTQSYLRWGVARFELEGKACALTLFAFGDGPDESFFIPFRDATSGAETYAAGRYLEAGREAGPGAGLQASEAQDGRVLLDFNYAYNPFCAYSARYRCPLPPAENRLPVAVRAGERAFERSGGK